MPRFFAPLDLNWAEVRNAVTQNLATPPVARVTPGLRYYNTVTNDEQYWNGTRWIPLTDVIDSSKITGLGNLAFQDSVGTVDILPGSITNVQIADAAAIALSKLAVNPLDRANHTGLQLANTISDFDTQVRKSRLDQMALPTATVDFGGQILTNAGNPVLASDVANKSYVDTMSSGLDVKLAVKAASIGDLDLTGPGTKIDDYNLSPGDRVLVKNQVAGATNGIYIYNGPSANMTRAVDADDNAEVRKGLYVFVTGGTTNSNSGWMLNTPDPIIVGTTVLDFVQFSGGGATYTGTANRIVITGTQIDIAGTYLGQASLTTLGTVTTGTWNATPIDIAHGGTGATTNVGARAALGTIGKMTAAIGDGISTQFDITHNFNTMAVGVELYELQTGQTVYADVSRLTANVVRIEGFVDPPALNGGAGAIGVVVWG
jgi:hypothetical protein